MGGRHRINRLLAWAAGFAALAAAPALAQYPDDYDGGSPGMPSATEQPAATVAAEGNAFEPGSLKFDPASVSVKVGEIVRWKNTDFAVPHTSSEDHGLWHLGGDYGAPPFGTGYGPGESRERRFEAGTHRYFCRIHPDDMKGTVAVPVTLAVTKRIRRRSGRRVVERTLAARWAATAPESGLVFDVDRRTRGVWKSFKRGTRMGSARFAVKRGSTWQLRARLRKGGDAAAATDWSPVASATAQ